MNRSTTSTSGHALLIQILIVVVIAAAVALPFFFVIQARASQKREAMQKITSLVNSSHKLKEQLKKAYDRVARTSQRLPFAERNKREYDQEFTALFRRYYPASKGLAGDGASPSLAELVALQREFEEYQRRLSGQYERLRTVLDLVDLAEKAVVLARHYQTGLTVVRETAPFGPNRLILPQLEEADRQLSTAMNFVLSGIEKFPQDLQGRDTPVLIKTGIEQVRRVTADVDLLLDRLQGTAETQVKRSNVATMSLAQFLDLFRQERQKTRLPDLSSAAGPTQARGTARSGSDRPGRSPGSPPESPEAR